MQCKTFGLDTQWYLCMDWLTINSLDFLKWLPNFLGTCSTEKWEISFIIIHLGLGALIKLTRPFLQCVSKARAGRIVRDLLDRYFEIYTVEPENNAAVSLLFTIGIESKWS